MRRTIGIILLSLPLSGLWSQFWHLLGPPSVGGARPVPTCGGSGNPDGSCQPGSPSH
jgi:hypothetical protein